MASEARLDIVLCWHMHQPDYRDHLRGEFLQPWAYLHAIKDYTDMAAHLEAVPAARAVVNFSPVLLSQLMEYERQIQGYLQNNLPIRDPLLAMLDSPVFPADNEHRVALVKACLRSNRKRLIERFKPYLRLTELAQPIIHDSTYSAYLSNQFLADLITWYHLVWLGETVRRADPRVNKLIEQGAGYTLHQRRLLLELIGDLLAGLKRRYAALSGAGRVELSMSPYAHPMVPLLLQFKDARESMPDVRLPVLKSYPGGKERVRWHLQRGLEVFEKYFGVRPVGCWPSEGGISAAALKAIGGAGFQWTATGENVLRNSLDGPAGKHPHAVHSGYLEPASGIRLFARDDALSDRIAFSYADWHADHAVADLVQRLAAVADACAGREDAVVSIIMDGENAWEYYPENAYYFLSALYQRLAEHPRLRMTTYREALQKPAGKLDRIVAGSWVYGTFSTWIGAEDKNRAWDILGDVKRIYDECRGRFSESQLARIDEQLAVCEGSDWFWWLGDYNPAAAVSDFENLYRVQIANLYHLLGQEPPQYLSQTLSHGSGTPALGGVILPGTPAT
jgi:alpha-amylase/alpha-mannosidase (GH57 family)